MINLLCSICKTEYKVKPYRKNSLFCSLKCKGVWHSKKMKGNNFAEGHKPWNNGIKGLHLSPNTEFKIGHNVWNKNLKGIHLSPDSEFKLGHTTIRHVPIGTVTMRIDRSGTGRHWIKIGDPFVWILYSHFLWQKEGLEIPFDMVIHHINGDSSDDRIENLQCLTRSEHTKIHNKHNSINKDLSHLRQMRGSKAIPRIIKIENK